MELAREEEAETGRRSGTGDSRLVRLLMESGLTKAQKCYIILYYRDGLTVQEIAKRCGVVPSTVSRTMMRGRNRLARELSRLELRKAFDSEKNASGS
ncbi:MAG: sigma-70 family RNA polymerase sigma factor [Ruminococcus sp.]|nr:sigma-70 family RNA polymerase sigma factor [Ruminococcus sp.]